MHGAKERPFSAGSYPITNVQVKAMVRLLIDLCEQYNIAVTPQTVLTHAEVQGTLGIAQSGKWDVTWLPGMDHAGHPSAVGDLLRQKIRDARRAPSDKQDTTPPYAPYTRQAPDWLSAIIRFLKSVFSR
jgi:hypothetical protein